MALSKLQEAIKEHEEQVKASLSKNGITSKLVVHFPNKKTTPLLGQLGVWCVNKAGGIIATKYELENGSIISKEGKKSR